MAEEKRYYWLRLKKDFFKRHDIQIVENMPNGKDYILFYLKLLCEGVDHDGNLRFNDQIPYNEQMLATITNTNIDIVKHAIELFTNLQMMEVLDDGTYYLNEVKKMMGSESYWAEKKRKQREIGHCPKDVQYLSNEIPTCPGKRIEKEIDKEIDKEKDKKKINYQQIADMYNNTCVSFPRITKLSDARKKAIKARLNSYTIEDLQNAFTLAESSEFLKGSNSRNWSANFDWIIKDGNIAKILDGNYTNAPKREAVNKDGTNEADHHQATDKFGLPII